MDLAAKRFGNMAAALLLGVLFVFALESMRGDALTYDEQAHIVAGYSYLAKQDYRVNPEHPPLAKDMAALPLLFLAPQFPDASQNWLQDASAPAWWVQFDLGREFLYRSGNDPKQIVFWSRLPMIALLLFLGWFVFQWAKKLGGMWLGLGTLALFSLSPILLAHGRLVTTDVAAALGAVLATYFWLQFLSKPHLKNVFLAGALFGVAMLLKFSLILLVPFFGILTILYPLIFFVSAKEKGKALLAYVAKAGLAGIVGVVFVIWPVYQLHTFNYPPERQKRDTSADLQAGGISLPEQLVITTADTPVLRALSQYARGLFMVFQRSAGGNTTYFMGEVAASSWWYYFPLVYFLKTPFALHLLSMLGTVGVLLLAWRTRMVGWIKEHFAFFAFMLFVAIYWASAIAGNLNIGVRHLIPTLPFLFMLSVWGMQLLLSLFAMRPLRRIVLAGILALFAWYGVSSARAFPYYISYTNEIAGGTSQGYTYAVDSNYDWGQDFFRLMRFIEVNNIQKIHLDYFGGEDPAFWLKEKYIPLNPKNTRDNVAGWVAVSANQLQGGRATPAKGFQESTDYYLWLDLHEPVARAGTSIFIYYIQ